MNLGDILRTANNNLLRSKTRTLLTIISIFVGAFTITLTTGITSGVSSYIDDQLGMIGAENVLLVRPETEERLSGGPREYEEEAQDDNASGPVPLPTLRPDDIEKISAQPGIVKVKPMLVPQVDYVQHDSGDKYVMNLQPYIEGANFEMLAGQLPSNDSDSYEVTVPESFLEPLGLGSKESAVGKELQVAITNQATKQQSTVTATIVGVQAPSLVSNAGGMMNDTLATELHEIQTTGLPDNLRNQYLGASAFVAEDASEEQIQAIKDGLKEKGYQASTIADQIGIINDVINAITAVLIFFGAIALLAASFGIINTLFMAVQERTKEIGLMKAMGMGRNRVFLLFSVEAILLGFWGSLLGVLAAVGAGQVVNNIAADSFLKELVGFELTVFPVASLALIVAIVMAIAFLAGTLPARRAARLDPISALRYE